MHINTRREAVENSQIIFQNAFALLQQGKFEEADQLLLQAHQLDSSNVDVLNLLGIRSYQKQDYEHALRFLNCANLLTPNSAQTLSNLGLIHTAMLDFKEALHCFDLAITSNTNIPEAHNNRGNALKSLGRNKESVEAYKQALVLRPNYAEALSNQGVIFLEEGLIENAITLFEQALQCNPNHAVAYNNLGNALTQLGQFESAFQCFELAIQIQPGYFDACINFGNSLRKCKQISAAIDCYQHALKINPENANAFYLLGEIYYDTGDYALAKTYYAKSLDLNPHNLEVQYALAIAQLPKVYKDTQELTTARAAFAQQLKSLKAFHSQENNLERTNNILSRHPFYLSYQDENNKSLLSEYGLLCVELAQQIQGQLSRSAKTPQLESKIRVGVVSHYFCNHPVWHAITKGWLAHLNPNQFDLILFNTNGKEDSETQFAKLKSSAYINCSNFTLRAAQIIFDQNIDVLLYPEIGMDGTSRALSCLRLAPVQVVSWGHPETTGLCSIDFYLSAALLEPNSPSIHYSEELIQLPNLGTYFEQQQVLAIKPNWEEFGINPTSPILLCPGSPSKYTGAHDDIFVEIAKRLRKCEFIFFNFDDNLSAILKERLNQAFFSAQLDPSEFIRFLPFLQKEEFFGLMQSANVYLDTIGFSGFNTAMQAIECNLPIVTMEGDMLRGRLASGILKRLGLQELVCHSKAAYINLVVKLVENSVLSNSYKTVIKKNKSILFNDLQPIRALENFLIKQTKQ